MTIKKLKIELVPSTVWYSSLYKLFKELHREDLWKNIKDSIFKKEGKKCWICENTDRRLEAHEFWDYDAGNHIQKLKSIHHLCDLCHKVKHIGLWLHTSDGQKMLKKEKLTKSDIIKHFCKVNQCTKKEFEEHKDSAFEIFSIRSQNDWNQDFGKYQKIINDAKKRNPSEVTDSYWVYAESNESYPNPTENCGKWLVFDYTKNLDETWSKIAKAVEEGLLGSSAKSATALPNPNATNQDIKVICVYTYDSEDKEDVARIAWELYNIGVAPRVLNYKTDKATLEGKYVKRGHTKVSRYSVSINHFKDKNKEQFIEFFKNHFQ